MRALRQRCIGKERNDACIKLTNLVYNMLCFGQIQRLGIRYSRPPARRTPQNHLRATDKRGQPALSLQKLALCRETGNKGRVSGSVR
jgi:hypothetical protein